MTIRNEEEEILFHVGPGTPSGEVLRRYWFPIELSNNLGGGGGGRGFLGVNNPLKVKILGEHLVLFRDGQGKVGLMAEHCSHRGTSLAHGCVEEEGLRCIYHGWLYNTEGQCLETPAEPPDSNFRLTVKHPSYPCVEVGGLIFTYMGPPDKQPLFPKYPQLFRDDGVRLTGNGKRIQKSNVFLQTLDNVLDIWHREINHGWFKGQGRPGNIHWGKNGQPATPVKMERTPWGACYVTLQNTKRPGVFEYHETHAVLPGQRLGQPGGSSINWATPVDDYTTHWFGVSFVPFDDTGRVPEAVYQRMNSQMPNDSGGPFFDGWAEDVGKWWNLGHPLRQGPIWEDEIAMGTQGPEERNGLPDWDKWRLGTSDRGVVLMHELWREQVDRVQRGEDPLGVVRDPKDDILIPIPGELKHVDWEEGMRMFNMSLEERSRRYEERINARRYALARG